ncbi:hypothetical protein DFA_10161 [Cavenderia fasciculata]|uniref:Uncharacterized protein n=1 Tax=Cavenderia fasciculata TaxID=261658 RepID=F4Q9F8_CACFS|nr:uncharacterized protein DFA_10161 [Cavenderia fasciculata]EGG15327.1 hypothetical protein DFA_10161 [Cavenderia fasciculata]|eukprot:XP_004352047.1 hypothetical protein DFA_10161 [Cavenderia fasciculata]
MNGSPPLEFIQLVEQEDDKTIQIQIQKYIDKQIEDVISWLFYLLSNSQDETILSNSNRLLSVVMEQTSNKALLVDLLKSKIIESTKQAKSNKNMDMIVASIQSASNLLYPTE